MKKLILFVFSIYSLLSFSQDLVSTTPSKKSALLEEFTAAGCGNCPTGHSIATVIENENPGQIISIRYHHGGLASPQNEEVYDFRTDFSNAIAQQANAVGQPLGSVNRHLFDGQSSSSQSVGKWQESCLEIIAQEAIVNIGAMATIDSNTNELEIIVELYYTGTQTASTNLLNIALLQNNIEAAQTAYSVPQPNDFLENGLYSHKHVLRHLITGQWGFTINVDEGPFIRKKFNYNIPQQFRNIPVDLTNLELAIFINEGNQEVLNTISINPKFCPLETVSIQDSENMATKIYPNPAYKNARINIETKAKDIDQINIIDITGSILYQDNSFNEHTTVEIGNLNYKPGIYFVQFIQNKNAITNEKLIIY